MTSSTTCSFKAVVSTNMALRPPVSAISGTIGPSLCAKVRAIRRATLVEPVKAIPAIFELLTKCAPVRPSPSAASSRATGPGFLDSARYPDIRLDLQGLRPEGGARYMAEAEVTIRGQTRTIAFPVDLRVSGDRAHLTGAFALDRADFGIGTSGPWNGLVGRQVTVRVALQAQRG